MPDEKNKPAVTLVHSVETPEVHRELLSAACGRDNERFSELVDRFASRASLVLLKGQSLATNASGSEDDPTSTENSPDS